MYYILGVPEKRVFKKTLGNQMKPHWESILLGIQRYSLFGLFSKRYHLLGENDQCLGKMVAISQTLKISTVFILSRPYSTLKIISISQRASLCLCL